MNKTGFASTAFLVGLLATITTATSQGPPRNGLYQIKSGSYLEVGGFAGSITYKLPSPHQAFVSLLIDPAVGDAELTFLDQDRRAGFFRLTNGIVSGNIVRFHCQTVNPYSLTSAQVDYAVTNAAGVLWISGSITSSPVCCDIPYLFEHQDVQATFVPALSIRVSEVELCWSSESNHTYQVQYHSELTAHVWTDFGARVEGNGTTNCVADRVAPGQAQRFYRIVTAP